MVHMRDMGPRGLHPFGHGVGILARVLLDGTRCAAVRVSFAQHWVDRGANALGVALPDGFLLIRFRIAGVIRNFVALGLQLFDRSGELRDGGADVGQLNDIGIRLQCFLPSSDSVSGMRCASERCSGKLPRIRAAREMSAASIWTLAGLVKARITGKKACVASIGASSVRV